MVYKASPTPGGQSPFKALVDPTNKFIYVDIAKNASTKIVGVLTKAGWTNPPYMAQQDIDSYLEDKKIFCVLREPYQRYIAGFPDYLSSAKASNYNEVIGYSLRKLLRFDSNSNFHILRLAFLSNKFDFDIHTELQCSSLISFDITKIDFFYLNPKLGFQLSKYFQRNSNFIPFNNDKVNSRPDENFYKLLLRNFFEKEEHVMFKENLLNYLKPDYDLIKSITFYDI